jgi:hypothetical protein
VGSGGVGDGSSGLDATAATSGSVDSFAPPPDAPLIPLPAPGTVPVSDDGVLAALAFAFPTFVPLAAPMPLESLSAAGERGFGSEGVGSAPESG